MAAPSRVAGSCCSRYALVADCGEASRAKIRMEESDHHVKAEAHYKQHCGEAKRLRSIMNHCLLPDLRAR